MGPPLDAYNYSIVKSYEEYIAILRENMENILTGNLPFGGQGFGHHFEIGLAQVLHKYPLRDTNGICWQVAALTARSFYDPIFAEHVDFSSLEFVPTAFQFCIDNGVRTPVIRFEQKYQYTPNEFENGITIDSSQTIKNWISRLSPNQALLVEVMLNYPNRNSNQLPHWLAVLTYDGSNDSFLIGGDFTPFGINDTYLLKVPADVFQQAVAKTALVDNINGWIVQFPERSSELGSRKDNSPPHLGLTLEEELMLADRKHGIDFFHHSN